MALGLFFPGNSVLVAWSVVQGLEFSGKFKLLKTSISVGDWQIASSHLQRQLLSLREVGGAACTVGQTFLLTLG